MVILAGVFRFQTQDGKVYELIPTRIKFDERFFITVCLLRAGEIFPDKTATDENNDDKFGQLMRNKTVHLLAIFLMVYIGVEVTIGGMIFASTT